MIIKLVEEIGRIVGAAFGQAPCKYRALVAEQIACGNRLDELAGKRRIPPPAGMSQAAVQEEKERLRSEISRLEKEISSMEWQRKTQF